MERNMELVRHILLTARSADGFLSDTAFLVSDGRFSKQAIIYHIEIMSEHGLVQGHTVRADSGEYFAGQVGALTWEGQDFCDAIADDRVWAKALKVIKTALGSASFAVTCEVLRRTALNLAEPLL